MGLNEAQGDPQVRRDEPFVDVLPAGKAMPGLRKHVVLHAGPPIKWDRMCGPMRGAIAGALVFESWAPDLRGAMKLAASSAVRFHPNHHYGAVGPMTGITTRSMPVMVVENRSFHNRSYCMINEGLGKVLRFGANSPDVAKLGVAIFPTDYSIRPDDFARACEERGFESLWFAEHSHIPIDRKSVV